MLCRYSRAHPYFDDVPVVVVVEAPAPLVWDACLAPLEVGDDRNRRERRGRWAAPAEPSAAPAIGALGAKPRRRRSFDAAAGAAPALLHELRSFYDRDYRLKVVKDRLLHEMRHRDWGMAQLFEILDEDGDGELDCDEIGDALRRCGVPLRDVELRAAKESEIPNFKGSSLGRFPLVSADFWTSDHLSERSRSVDAFLGTRARGTLTLKRR